MQTGAFRNIRMETTYYDTQDGAFPRGNGRTACAGKTSAASSRSKRRVLAMSAANGNGKANIWTRRRRP